MPLHPWHLDDTELQWLRRVLHRRGTLRRNYYQFRRGRDLPGSVTAMTPEQIEALCTALEIARETIRKNSYFALTLR